MTVKTEDYIAVSKVRAVQVDMSLGIDHYREFCSKLTESDQPGCWLIPDAHGNWPAVHDGYWIFWNVITGAFDTAPPKYFHKHFHRQPWQ